MFSSRLLLNLGLFVAIVILAASAFFLAQEKPATSSFSTLKADEVTSIRIQYNDQTTELVKEGSGWKIIKPVNIDADEFRSQAILNIISKAPEKFYTIEAAALKKYSLDPPLATLKLNQQNFLFGSTSPINQLRYVLSDSKLFLIDDTFFPLITSGFKNLMRRQLLPVNQSIKQLEFVSGRVYKDDKGGWRYERSGSPTDISADTLKHFIDNWTHIQAYAVTVAAPPYSGMRFNVKTDNRTITFFVEKTDSGTVVINPELGLAYQFAATAYVSLTDISSHQPADQD